MTSSALPASHVPSAFGVTIGGLFLNQVRHRGGAAAMETRDGTLSVAELNARANRTAHLLASLGVRRGNVVAVLAENRHEFVEVQLAAAKLGACVACQNWRLADDELAYCLKLVKPGLLFVSPAHAARLQRLALGDCAVLEFGDAHEQRLAAFSDAEPEHAAVSEDPWVILYTSGSTGYPKAAAISHRALVARGTIAVADGFITPGRTFLAWAPMFHIASTDAIMITLLHGGKVILRDGFDADFIAHTVTTQEVGTLSLMPATVAPMIEVLRRMREPVRPLRATGAMADMVPPRQIAEITTLLGAPYRNSFGSTETGYAPASRGTIPVGVVPTSFGKTQSSYCEVRLVDQDGTDVPDGQPGEVLVRGPSLFSGYWNAPDINATLFSRGWYAMGDVMRRNPDGTLDFVDRRKYLIKSGGENIYPAEIERLLLESPRVSDAVVVRQAHDHWGEVPVAFVVPRDDTLDTDAVLALLRGRIANYKLPKRVVLVGESDLPRTAIGKVQRHVLEERLKLEKQA